MSTLSLAEIGVALRCGDVAGDRAVFPADAGERKVEAAVIADRNLELRLGEPRRARLDQLAVLDQGAAALAVALPLRLHAQLGIIGRRRGKCGKRDTAARLEAVLERALAVMLGVVLGILVTHHEPAHALTEIVEPAGTAYAHDRGEQASLALVLEGKRKARAKLNHFAVLDLDVEFLHLGDAQVAQAARRGLDRVTRRVFPRNSLVPMTSVTR